MSDLGEAAYWALRKLEQHLDHEAASAWLDGGLDGAQGAERRRDYERAVARVEELLLTSVRELAVASQTRLLTALWLNERRRDEEKATLLRAANDEHRRAHWAGRAP